MPKHYKILLSAYACEPNKGSEPGVGWHWALEIAKRGHQVWVLTRKNNQTTIELYFRNNSQPDNIHFLYYDLPKWLSFWKKGGKGVHLYYLLWQICIFKFVLYQQKKINFDFIHHITFVTIHQPSFLFLIRNTKFIYGPSAGGDLVPFRFLKSFPLSKRIKEYLLYLQDNLLLFDPIRRFMFTKSNLIFCNSKKTKSYLPQSVQKKTYINLAIGSKCDLAPYIPININRKLEILFVGNLLHWKGIHLALKSYKLIANNIDSSFTIIGNGFFKEKMNLSQKDSNIRFIPWISQNELFELYQNYDVMLFPSFRDSGGMVVLEAMSNGLPVVCLDLGGPGQIVNETCGRVITTINKSEVQVVQSIYETIIGLNTNRQFLQELSNGAIKRAEQFTWEKTVGRVYEVIENYMQNIHLV